MAVLVGNDGAAALLQHAAVEVVGVLAALVGDGVIACAEVVGVVSAFVGEAVVSRSACKGVVSRSAVQPAAVAACGQPVVSCAAVQFVMAAAADEGVIAVFSVELVLLAVVVAGVQAVVACAAIEPVMARAGIKLVVSAGRVGRHVLRVVSVEGVVAFASVEDVVARLSGDPVVACAAVQDVVGSAFGYALLLHEADARAQGEAVTRSVRLGLPVPFVDAAIGDHNGVHGVGAVCAGLLKLLRGRIPAVAARACACVGLRYDAACHAVLRIPQDEVIACAAFDVIAARAAKEHIFCAAAVNVVAARFAADPVASLVALAVVPLPLIIVTGAPQPVVACAAVDHVGVWAFIFQMLFAVVVIDGVNTRVSFAKNIGVFSCPAFQPVVARAAFHTVVSIAAIQAASAVLPPDCGVKTCVR